jgi:hypothetical protein
MHITERRDGTIRIELRGDYADDLEIIVDADYHSRPVRVGDEGCLSVSGRDGCEDHAYLYPTAIPGNSNHRITRYHGWRGTTCDVACYARGWRRVESVEPRKRGRGLAIVLSADLRPDEE